MTDKNVKLYGTYESQCYTQACYSSDSCLKKLKEKTHIDVFCLEDIEDIGNAVIQYFE